MAAITHIRSLEYAAKMMGEDLELLEAIVGNDDNLTIWFNHHRPNWPGGGNHCTDQLRLRRTDRHAQGCPRKHQNLARIPQ